MSSVSPRKDKDSANMVLSDNRRVAVGPESRYTEPTRTSSSSFKPPMSKEAALKKEAPKPVPESSIYSAFSYVKGMFSGKSVSETSTRKELNNKGQNVKNMSANEKNKKVSNANRSGSIMNMKDIEHTKPVVDLQPQTQYSDLRVSPVEKPERTAYASFSPKLDGSGKPGFAQGRKKDSASGHDSETQLKYNHIRFVENTSTYLHTPDKKGTTSFRITTGPNVNVKPVTHQSPILQQKKGGKMESKTKKMAASPRRSRKSGSTPGSPSRVRRKPSPDRNMVKQRPVSLSTSQKSLKYTSQTNAHQSKSSFCEYELPVANVKTSPKASNVKNSANQSGNHHMLTFTSETMSRSDPRTHCPEKVSRLRKTTTFEGTKEVTDAGHKPPVQICESSNTSFKIKSSDNLPHHSEKPLVNDPKSIPSNKSAMNDQPYLPPTVIRKPRPTAFAPPSSNKSREKTKDSVRVSSSIPSVTSKAEEEKTKNRTSSPNIGKGGKKRKGSPSPNRKLDRSTSRNAHHMKSPTKSANQRSSNSPPNIYPSRILVRRSPHSSPSHEIVTAITSTVPVSVNLGGQMAEGISDRGLEREENCMNLPIPKGRSASLLGGQYGHGTIDIGAQQDNMDLVTRVAGDGGASVARECSSMDLNNQIKLMKGIYGARDLLAKRSEHGGSAEKTKMKSPTRTDNSLSRGVSSDIQTSRCADGVQCFSPLREPTVLIPTMMNESFPFGPDVQNRSNSAFCCNTHATKSHETCFQYANVDFEIDFFGDDIFYEKNTCNSALSRKAIGLDTIQPTCLMSETDKNAIYEIPFGPSLVVEKTNAKGKKTHNFCLYTLSNDEPSLVEKDGAGISINFFADETIPKDSDSATKMAGKRGDQAEILNATISNKQNETVKMPDRDFPILTTRSRSFKAEKAEISKSTIPYNGKGKSSPGTHKKVTELTHGTKSPNPFTRGHKERANSTPPRLNVEKKAPFLSRIKRIEQIVPDPVENLASTIPYNKKRSSSPDRRSSSPKKHFIHASRSMKHTDNDKMRPTSPTRFLEARSIVQSSPSFEKPTFFRKSESVSPSKPIAKRSISTAIGEAFGAIADAFKGKPREVIPPQSTLHTDKAKPEAKPTRHEVEKPLSATMSYISSFLGSANNSSSPKKKTAEIILGQKISTPKSPELKKTRIKSPKHTRSPNRASPRGTKRGKKYIPPTVLENGSISPPKASPRTGTVSKAKPSLKGSFAIPVVVTPPKAARGSPTNTKSKQRSPDAKTIPLKENVTEPKRSKIDPIELLRETIKVTLQPKLKRDISESPDSNKIDFNNLMKSKIPNSVTKEPNVQPKKSPSKCQQSPQVLLNAPKEKISPPKQKVVPSTMLASPSKAQPSPTPIKIVSPKTIKPRPASKQSILESLESPGNQTYTQSSSPPKIASDATLHGELP